MLTFKPIRVAALSRVIKTNSHVCGLSKLLNSSNFSSDSAFGSRNKHQIGTQTVQSVNLKVNEQRFGKPTNEIIGKSNINNSSDVIAPVLTSQSNPERKRKELLELLENSKIYRKPERFAGILKNHCSYHSYDIETNLVAKKLQISKLLSIDFLHSMDDSTFSDVLWSIGKLQYDFETEYKELSYKLTERFIRSQNMSQKDFTQCMVGFANAYIQWDELPIKTQQAIQKQLLNISPLFDAHGIVSTLRAFSKNGPDFSSLDTKLQSALFSSIEKNLENMNNRSKASVLRSLGALNCKLTANTPQYILIQRIAIEVLSSLSASRATHGGNPNIINSNKSTTTISTTNNSAAQRINSTVRSDQPPLHYMEFINTVTGLADCHMKHSELCNNLQTNIVTGVEKFVSSADTLAFIQMIEA